MKLLGKNHEYCHKNQMQLSWLFHVYHLSQPYKDGNWMILYQSGYSESPRPVLIIFISHHTDQLLQTSKFKLSTHIPCLSVQSEDVATYADKVIKV